ncbi:MAG: S1 RNA-binding domain-containing protein, partial [Terriglobales bacterium]
GTAVRVAVTEIGEKDGKERIKVSVFAVVKAERTARSEARKAVIAALVAGETVITGTVSKVLPEVGVLVKVGEGVDGLVHFSQLEGGKSRLATIAEGTEVTAKVLKVTEEEKEGRKRTKISLSESALVQAELTADLEEGQLFTATVKKAAHDGLQLDLGRGLDGFLPFEELAGTSREALTKARNQRTRVRFVRMDGNVAVCTREGVGK